MSKWTQFMDMHSGGGRKLDWEYIYIEAPRAEAEIVFYNRFGRNPNRVTCTCCGNDYSVTESDSLEDATAYERGCRYVEGIRNPKPTKGDFWLEEGYYIEPGVRPPKGRKLSPSYRGGDGLTLPEYVAKSDSKFIYAADILASERVGDLPEQGYVWRD